MRRNQFYAASRLLDRPVCRTHHVLWKKTEGFSSGVILLANQGYTVNTLQAAPKQEDFPALGGPAAADKRPSSTAGPSSSQHPSTQLSAAGPAADGAAAATGVSDALKAANKARSLRPTQRPVSTCSSSLFMHIMHMRNSRRIITSQHFCVVKQALMWKLQVAVSVYCLMNCIEHCSLVLLHIIQPAEE